jgi:PPOX class probable FMN-dependent enzyme
MDAPFSHLITSEDELRSGPYPEPRGLALDKEITELDAHCRDFLARSPLALLATAAPDGTCEVTPRGGPPGFLRVLDPHRLAFADLTGNRRVDALCNIVANPQAALLVLLPGLGETLRIRGRAYVTRDPEVLAATAVPGRSPDVAVGLAVEVAYLHCAKALIRSKLWDPATWPEELPSAARIFRDHARSPTGVQDMEDHLAAAYRDRLW